MLYIILVILIFYLALRILILPRGKKNQRAFLTSFHDAVAPVERMMADKFKQVGFHVDNFRRMINDQGQGIVLAYDKTQDKFSIGMKDSFFIEDGSKVSDVEKVLVKEGRRYSSAQIKFKVGASTYTYDIATQPFNPHGFLEKTIMEILEDFYGDMKAIQNMPRERKEISE